MARKNRTNTDDAEAQEYDDTSKLVRRPAFETPVSSYETQDGNVLLAEAGKGAAWIEADPADVVNAGDWE